MIRFALRPFIWRWLKINFIDSEAVTDYITNYLCFIALSVETFMILYVKEIVKYVTVLLFIDTFVFIGLLFICEDFLLVLTDTVKKYILKDGKYLLH